jgi:hypothetical protein
VFLADGGGGGGTSSGPSFSGTQTLSIEPSAIPAALAAFRAAHERVLRKVAELDGMTVRPWAGDQVSAETAKQFAERSYGGAESAMQCLRGYEEQLNRACQELQRANDAYVAMEGDNAALWGRRS